MNRQSEFISLLLKDFESCSSDLLWETDAEGKLIYFSDRLPTLVGTETGELLGKTFREAAVASPEAEGWDDFLKLSGNRVAIEALRLEVKRGTSSSDWWMVTAQPLRGHAGDFLGYRGVIRDISLERRAQIDLIKAKEEAERASSAKSQFLAITSHELKTPLNAIVGFSEMLVAQRDGPLGSPAYSEYATTILQSSSHLRTIIADILDVTRIERGALSSGRAGHGRCRDSRDRLYDVPRAGQGGGYTAVDQSRPFGRNSGRHHAHPPGADQSDHQCHQILATRQVRCDLRSSAAAKTGLSSSSRTTASA